MDETHDDFMARIREMSSAKYRPLGLENPRASSSAKMTGTKVNAARRAAKSEVVALFGRGKSDEEIAAQLGLSVDQVKSLRMMRLG
jgi:DNA-binding NarL/FixJ family response regulator